MDAVLFDFGHTLFEPPSAAAILVEKGLEEELARSLWREILEASTSAAELAKGRDLDARRHRELWTALFARADPHLPGVSEELYERVMPPERWTPYPDTEPVLRALHERGLRLGVVSNVASPLQPAFRRHGLERYLGGFVHSYEHEIEKPDPRIFLAACALLETEPARTLMVGDNPLADGGAARAGLPTLILPDAPEEGPRGLEVVLALA